LGFSAILVDRKLEGNRLKKAKRAGNRGKNKLEEAILKILTGLGDWGFEGVLLWLIRDLGWI